MSLRTAAAARYHDRRWLSVRQSCRVQGHDKRDTCNKTTGTAIESSLACPVLGVGPAAFDTLRFTFHTHNKARAV